MPDKRKLSSPQVPRLPPRGRDDDNNVSCFISSSTHFRAIPRFRHPCPRPNPGSIKGRKREKVREIKTWEQETGNTRSYVLTQGALIGQAHGQVLDRVAQKKKRGQAVMSLSVSPLGTALSVPRPDAERGRPDRSPGLLYCEEWCPTAQGELAPSTERK